MYSLNLAEDGRILSVCECVEGWEYENVVESFPEGNVAEYRYANGSYVYDPLPVEPDTQEPTAEEDTLNMLIDHEERLINLELGMTE